MWAVLVVQGVWASGRLALWAEDPALPLTSSRAQASHPFAVPGATLAAVLADSSDDVREALAKAVAGELTLSLPGGAKGPLPSPETGAEPTAKRLALRQ